LRKTQKVEQGLQEKNVFVPRNVIMYVPVPVPSTANIGGTYGGVLPWYYNTPSIPPRWYFFFFFYRVTYAGAISSHIGTYVCGIFRTVCHFYSTGEWSLGWKRAVWGLPKRPGPLFHFSTQNIQYLVSQIQWTVWYLVPALVGIWYLVPGSSSINTMSNDNGMINNKEITTRNKEKFHAMSGNQEATSNRQQVMNDTTSNNQPVLPQQCSTGSKGWTVPTASWQCKAKAAAASV